MPLIADTPPREVIAHSERGRAVVARRIGSAGAARRILVVGAIHGNERAGVPVLRALRSARPPRGVQIVLVDTVNPDGDARNTRQNARGVDLNRNWPVAWSGGGRAFDTYFPGAAPLSEPESRGLSAYITRLRPRATLYYHQHMRLVDRSGGDPFLTRLYARAGRLPWRGIDPLPGTATRWQNRTYPGDTAFVVELPAGRLSPAGVRRHRGAVLALARAVAPPPVRSTPIPYGAQRRAQMRAYARRHYGLDTDVLKPRVIVEHFTASNSFQSAFQTFARNQRDAELGELPGVCAHYLIDRDGTIHRLVRDTLMCRHTVGLNWAAIGIEHVGTSDGQVLGNARQRRASLRLTRSLQGRYRIATKNVIGHAESLSSPFHRERVARLRRQTHGDFRRASMNRYRAALRRLPAARSLR